MSTHPSTQYQYSTVSLVVSNTTVSDQRASGESIPTSTLQIRLSNLAIQFSAPPSSLPPTVNSTPASKQYPRRDNASAPMPKVPPGALFHQHYMVEPSQPLYPQGRACSYGE